MVLHIHTLGVGHAYINTASMAVFVLWLLNHMVNQMVAVFKRSVVVLSKGWALCSAC